jgi:hypothetical protein
MNRFDFALRCGPAKRISSDRSGVSLIEFALALPLLVGFTLGGLEMANYILAVSTTQRLATMMADMVAQSGVGGVSTSEGQIYDLFQALDVSAQPLNMRKNGRVIFTVIKGERQTDGSVRNVYADSIYAQQFDGAYIAATPILGCHSSQSNPTFGRILPPDEIMAHAQVTYKYEPILIANVMSYFSAPTEITRTANFRMRKNQFNLTDDKKRPVKNKCNGIDGV